MLRCSACLMPSTKPGIVLDDEGICQACRHYGRRSQVDWDARMLSLRKLADQYRRTDGYDSMIAVSGGKDSHFQVDMFKNELRMNPLLVSVLDPFTKTEAGKHNIVNLQTEFNCDMVSLNLNPNLVRKMVRAAFESFGSPTWPIDRAIYCFPVQEAIRRDIPLLVYGEDVAYQYGGVHDIETPSAINQIKNDVAKKVDWSFWEDHGIDLAMMEPLLFPHAAQIPKWFNPIYLSYYVPWDGHRNFKVATLRGFKTLEGEWDRDGYIENYDQIDSIGYLMNVWLKFPKFGFGRATDVAGYWIRSGKITKAEGIDLIRDNDHKLDSRILKDFNDFAESSG